MPEKGSMKIGRLREAKATTTGRYDKRAHVLWWKGMWCAG